MAAKKDCFAYRNWRGGSCTALTKLKCDDCNFYKPVGTECDSCSKGSMKNCEACKAARSNIYA